MAGHVKHQRREISGVVYFALALTLGLALATYHPLDPSWNVATDSTGARNWIGAFGAQISEALYQLLGLAAWLLPWPAVVVGWKKLRGRPLESVAVKTPAFVLLVLATSGLLALLLGNSPFPIREGFTTGGSTGQGIQVGLTPLLGHSGLLISLSAVLLISLIVCTRFSAEATLDWLGGKGHGRIADLRDRWRDWQERRRDRRELARIRSSESEVVTRQVPAQVTFDPVGPAATPGPVNGEPGTRPAVVEPAVRKLEFPPRPGVAGEPKRPMETDLERQFRLPSLAFLQERPEEIEYDEAELMERAQHLQAKCAEFDVTGRVQQIHPGPVVTTFEFKPDPGVKYSRITSLADDLCLALKSESVRIDRVPGKNTVGIEVPNTRRNVIYLHEILSSDEFQDADSVLTLAIGQRINGATYVADLTRMPHLLIAGSTGSGKSVGLNCMVCSVLYKARPEDVRMIMVDPKRLELGLYENIPHLLTPIVTDPKKAANALNWAVREMEERYRSLAGRGVRNISQFNSLARRGEFDAEGEDPVEPLPYILIVVDELADLMMTAGKDVETAVTRLAQMARAVGIHLILATQRPSVDVITGLIKANFPCRISFRVSSKVDSRTILDANGAEGLLGMGDMLYLSPETSRLIRVHGAYISEREIGRVVEFLREQGSPDYREEILEGTGEDDDDEAGDLGEIDDELYLEAARYVVEQRKASTSLLQRRFRIGYGRAARLLDIMQHEGIIGPPDGPRPREVLVAVNYFTEVEN